MSSKIGQKPTHTNPVLTFINAIISLGLMFLGIAVIGGAFKDGHPTDIAVTEFWAGILIFSLACYWALEITPWLEKKLGK